MTIIQGWRLPLVGAIAAVALMAAAAAGIGFDKPAAALTNCTVSDNSIDSEEQAFLGLINTYTGIIATHIIVVLPTIIWIMTGFFEDVPRELEDAALIDGCSRMSAFFRIILPLSRPGIVAVVILSFIASWNNFIFVLILGGNHTATLPLAVYSFMSFEDVNWGGLNAAATLITLPILLLSLLVQKQLARGLTMGAVKG